MRLAPLLALLLVAPVLHAQCAPDPTPLASYYPLGVGDEWVYRLNSERAAFLSRRVLREETVGGTVYAVDRTCRTEGSETTCEPERRVRFDAATATAVERLADGAERAVYGLRHLNAGFGFDFQPDCAADLGQEVTIGEIVYAVPRLKGEHAYDFRLPSLASGIGPTGYVNPTYAGDRTTRFEYARVRGVEYGVRPVAGESDAPSANVLALTAAPNPTSGVLRLTLAVSETETVSVEAFDALGRRVWQREATLAAATLVVDVSAWAPGVYVVRATAGPATATSHIVRR